MSGPDGHRRWLCQYVRNTGKVPLAVHEFDDDLAGGPMYRDDLVESGLIEVRPEAEDEPGGIYLTPAGEALCG